MNIIKMLEWKFVDIDICTLYLFQIYIIIIFFINDL
jgi:hypothetical protein